MSRNSVQVKPVIHGNVKNVYGSERMTSELNLQLS